MRIRCCKPERHRCCLRPLIAGHKTEEQLRALGVSTAADLRALPRAQLVARFGERVGALLHDACRGKVRCDRLRLFAHAHKVEAGARTKWRPTRLA